MSKIMIELTKEEVEVILLHLECNPCSGSCAYADMQSKNIDCDDCRFTSIKRTVEDKLLELNEKIKGDI